MSEETFSLLLARRLLSLRFDKIPTEVIEATKLHILDTLGCLLAGSRLEPGKLAHDLAFATSGGMPESSSMLFGTNGRVSDVDAVQAMATAAHCGELDDIHGGAGTCVGAMIVPSLIAMAEEYGGSGEKFLEAVVAGYETIVRIGLCIDAPKLFARGWWPSTLCGGFGVAAAGAKFIGWSAEQTANALGIVSLHAGGMLTGGNEGATARHLAFGRAAQNGIHSLLAAELGFTGPSRAFEDPRGFCLTLCSDPKWKYFTESERFYLPEVAFKPYPCARQLHAGVEALLKLRRDHAIKPANVEEIELEVPTQNAAMIDRPLAPTLRAATLGSGQYVMAVTALRGRIDLASFEEDSLRSGEVHDLMAKVKVRGSADLDRHFPKHWSGRVTVRSVGGKSCKHEVVIPKGETGNPMSASEVEQKFRSLAAPILGDEKADVVIREVAALGSRDSLARLFAALTLSEDRSFPVDGGRNG